MPFTDYAGTPFVPHLLPIIPKGSRINSQISADKIGKIPGLRWSDGGWTGFENWPSMTTPEGVLAKWAAWYADRPCQTIGLRAAALPGIDMDADHPVVAEIVYRNALFYLGHAPKRGRPNSRKYLLMYRLKPGEPPIAKKRLTFDDPWGQSYALELLGKGQHYLIEGEHQTGVQYGWDEHPLRFGHDQLTEITNKDVALFFTAVKETLTEVGFILTKGGANGSGNTNADRYPIEGHPDQCPDFDLLVDWLKTCRCDAPEFASRDDWLKALTAIKAACTGSDAFYDEYVLLWCTVEAWPGNTPEYVRGVWESIRDASLGWSYLCAIAQDFDWYGLAQSMFEVLPDEDEPADPTPPPPPVPPDESRIADEFVKANARRTWVYVLGDKPGQGSWRRCVDGIWIKDQETILADVSAMCCQVGDVIRRSPRATREELNTAKALHGHTKARSVLGLVRSRPEMHVRAAELDSRPLIMGVPGGYIDAEGLLRPPDPGLLLTRRALVAPDPSVPCQRFKAQLTLLANGDPQIVKALRRLIGYTMTGLGTEQIFVYLHGRHGKEGKTQFLRVLYLLMGGYATRVAGTTFMQVTNARRDFDLSDMEKYWFAFASEIDKGAEWAEARLKEATGGDGMHVEAKFEHGRDIDRAPALWFAGNHLPRFRDPDGALRRRTIVLECEHQVAEASVVKDYARQLVDEEGAGIMAFGIDCRQEYLAEGLYLPPQLTANRDAYFDRADKLLSFVEDEAEFGAEYQVEKQKVYERYKAWCATNGFRAEGRNEFYARLEQHRLFSEMGLRYEQKRTAAGRASSKARMVVGMRLSELDGFEAISGAQEA